MHNFTIFIHLISISMEEIKMNKSIAGFQMLHLLAAVDGNFSVEEDLIIRNYMVENFKEKINLDDALEQVSTLPSEDYILHFEKCMNEFYADSTEEERIHFMDFAVRMVKADNFLSQKENTFLKMLFDTWDAQPE
jgi:hypothetical protein